MKMSFEGFDRKKYIRIWLEVKSEWIGYNAVQILIEVKTAFYRLGYPTLKIFGSLKLSFNLETAWNLDLKILYEMPWQKRDNEFAFLRKK